MKQKKGLSPVVATIALILLTVGAVSLIAGFIVPFIKNQLEEGAGCVDYKDYFTFDDSFGFNCYENQGSYYLYGLSVRADSVSERVANNVEGFEMLFVETGDSIKIKVVEGSPPGFGDGGIKMWNSTRILEIPSDGGVRTYVYNSSTKISVIEIYPVLKKDSRICDRSGSIDVDNRVCSPAGVLS